ncbi:MAG: hypothetical protein ACOX27_10270 [Caldicoprobacterales bacterium]|nr:hypothetical protein [Clostridiales bacterium]
MIQIDDSGSGSLIGGTCIGAIRVETEEYVYDYIPVEYYRGDLFRSKNYLIKCGHIVLSLLERLNWKPDEEVEICRGYMFDQARKYLDERRIPYRSAKILEPLQSRIEHTFQEYALCLGLPLQYVKYTKYPLHFHRILRWVYADYRKRMVLCKTGWKSWIKYGNLKVDVKEDVLYKSNYICLKCGKSIRKGAKVKRLEYHSNCPNIIFLHFKCDMAEY